MSRFIAAVIVLIALAGCGSKAATPGPTLGPAISTHPTSTPYPTGQPIVVKDTVPPETAVPVKHHAHAGKGRHTTHTALPTPKPVHIVLPSPTPFPKSAYTATISGRVTDTKTHAPIAGAIIQVGTGLNHQVKTGPFGTYRITFPAGPPVSVQVTAQGYAGALAMGKLSTHKRAVVNFELSKVQAGKPVAPSPPMTFGNL
jgi:hypothetical protein